MKTELLQKQNKIQLLIEWIILFSLTDAFFTHMGIYLGLVAEANPFAKLLFETHLLLFYGFKVALPIILYVVYPKIKTKKVLNTGVIICFIAYLLVNLYHAFWIGMTIHLG